MERTDEKFKNELLGIAKHIDTVCILTAENPMGRAVSVEDNNRHLDKLYRMLKDGNFVYRKVKGKFNSNIENSVMICNIALDEAKSIAAKFSQEAFIHAVKKCPTTMANDYRGCEMMFSYYSIKDNYTSGKKQTIVDINGISHIENVIVPSAYKIRMSGDEMDHSVDNKEDDYTIYKNFRFVITFKIFAYYLQQMNAEFAKKNAVLGEAEYKSRLSALLENGRCGHWYFDRRQALMNC